MCIILVVVPGWWEVDDFLRLYHKIFPEVSVYLKQCETLLHSIPPAVMQVNNPHQKLFADHFLEDPRSLSWTWGGTSNEDLRNEK